MAGKRTRTFGRQPPDHLFHSVGCGHVEQCDYVKLQLDVGGQELLLLVDSGADISLIKSEHLVGSTEFDSRGKVRIKSVDASMMEMHGSIQANIVDGHLRIPFNFQLVSKQVDLLGDGILGQDFLRRMQAQICYRTRTMTFVYKGITVTKPLSSSSVEKRVGKLERQMRLSPRSETIVRLPVEGGTKLAEGLVDGKEIIPGVYLARSLVRIEKGYALTSVLNTTEEEVETVEPTFRICGIESTDQIPESFVSSHRDRYREVLDKLRTDHLSKEEKKSLEEICFEYQDVFFLPGDRLSCTGTVKHTIRLEPGTVPINTRPYRFPESQKTEIENQVTHLLKEGIIEESHSPGIAQY